MEKLSGLYKGCRSYRRFKQEKVPLELLSEMAEAARIRSSAMNQQVLRYAVIYSTETVKKVQPCLRWAAKLPKEIGTPKEGEQPTAFIVVLSSAKASMLSGIDMGIALDTMAIIAWQKGVGSCIVNNVDRKKLAEVIDLPEGFTIGPVLALGYPAHTSTIVAPDKEHGLSYYVDEERNYYVPKRHSQDVIKYY